MLEIHNGALDIEGIFSRWYSIIYKKNFGASTSFIGTVRDEDGISGLSFDIQEAILLNWFKRWEQVADRESAKIFMAHSKGDVLLQKASFVAFVASSKRRFALEFIDIFVEDFKSKAPIWKYDIINNQRVYKKKRGIPLPNSGLLGE